MTTDATPSNTNKTSRHGAHPHLGQAPDQSTARLAATLQDEQARPGGLERSFQDMKWVLRDDGSSHRTRLLRMQGWRGAELDQATAAGNAVRLAPGFCAAGAAAIVLSGSSILALILMATAVVGTGARNHPVESIYNWVAPAIGREPLPRNRASKRFGCLIGGALLATCALSIAYGSPAVGLGFAGALAVVAGFVSITNFCVPSAVFILLFGSERSTDCSLINMGSQSCSLQ